MRASTWTSGGLDVASETGAPPVASSPRGRGPPRGRARPSPQHAVWAIPVRQRCSRAIEAEPAGLDTQAFPGRGLAQVGRRGRRSAGPAGRGRPPTRVSVASPGRAHPRAEGEHWTLRVVQHLEPAGVGEPGHHLLGVVLGTGDVDMSRGAGAGGDDQPGHVLGPRPVPTTHADGVPRRGVRPQSPPGLCPRRVTSPSRSRTRPPPRDSMVSKSRSRSTRNSRPSNTVWTSWRSQVRRPGLVGPSGRAMSHMRALSRRLRTTPSRCSPKSPSLPLIWSRRPPRR